MKVGTRVRCETLLRNGTVVAHARLTLSMPHRTKRMDLVLLDGLKAIYGEPQTLLAVDPETGAWEPITSHLDPVNLRNESPIMDLNDPLLVAKRTLEAAGYSVRKD